MLLKHVTADFAAIATPPHKGFKTVRQLPVSRNDTQTIRMPVQLIWVVVIICILPTALNLLGVDFGSETHPLAIDVLNGAEDAVIDSIHHMLSGSFTHTILEWSAFCTAIFTVVLSFIHFYLKRDAVTPMIGVALFWAGCMDAFHTLAADRLIQATANNQDFIPFTWAICRLFNALILLIGAATFLNSPSKQWQGNISLVGSTSIGCGLVAYATISICAHSLFLPQTMFPQSLVHRPWDIAPLVIFILGGIFVFPQVYRKSPNLFSHALVISVIPQVATQLHMAFGSSALFDNHFNIAHFLKVVAYLIPFSGLSWDYIRIYRAEENAHVTIRRQEGKLAALSWALCDIASRQRAEAQLLHLAFHDSLTGLPNRTAFMNRLEFAIEQAKQHEDYQFAVLFLDLDRFKIINDSLGHIIGDQLLVGIADRLKACLHSSDLVARIGGDEFTILIEGLKQSSEAVDVADRIQTELTLPFELGEQEVFTTVSIGIALGKDRYDAHPYNKPEELLRDADIAMYRAKLSGKAQYKIFNPEMHALAVARLQLETALRRAVERQEFQLHYQPIVSLSTGRLAGFEALVRWQHPQYGLVYPSDFLATVEEMGLIVPIDRWVMSQACHQIRQWQQYSHHLSKLKISVNLCRQQFRQPDLIDYVNQVLEETGLDPQSLNLEITENVIMDSNESVMTTLTQLQALGIQLSIDDFGTGYSSLGRLHYVPINALKIDRSFIGNFKDDKRNLEIIEVIMTLAQKLNVAVTAEGVETQEQLVYLRELKCQFGQGYYFSFPLDAEAAEALIFANQQW